MIIFIRVMHALHAKCMVNAHVVHTGLNLRDHAMWLANSPSLEFQFKLFVYIFILCIIFLNWLFFDLFLIFISYYTIQCEFTFESVH